MRYELIKLGPLTIYSYGFMIAVGIVVALLIAQKRAKTFNLEADLIYNLAIWCLIGGIIGSKGLYILIELKNIINNPKILLQLSSGFVVYGGIIGGIVAGILYCKYKRLKFLKYFDLVMPSVAIAQAFGRIGCFMAGCCYGKETNSNFGVMFYNSPFAPNNVRLIPTQLISSLANFLNFIILIIFARKAKKDGQVAGLYLILYSIGRFLIEFLRNDLRGNVSIFSTSQFISIFIFIIGFAMFIVVSNKRKVN